VEDNYHKDPIANRRLHPETLMMGYRYAPGLSEGSLKPPIFLTSTFVFENAQQGKDFFDLTSGRRQPRPGEKSGLVYSRFNNPNLEILEDRLAIWDQAERSAVFASGMAANRPPNSPFFGPATPSCTAGLCMVAPKHPSRSRRAPLGPPHSALQTASMPLRFEIKTDSMGGLVAQVAGIVRCALRAVEHRSEGAAVDFLGIGFEPAKQAAVMEAGARFGLVSEARAQACVLVGTDDDQISQREVLEIIPPSSRNKGTARTRQALYHPAR
jgi:hypothetical protein